MKSILLVFLWALCLLPCSASAHDFMVDSICYNITSEKYMTCEVTFCSDPRPENEPDNFYRNVVFVPEKVSYTGKEYTVTAVGNDAFRRSDMLLSVVLPNTIVSIGRSAFSSCPNFKSFTLPASVRVFDSWAFALLPSLEYLAVEEGNELYDSREGCNAIIKTGSDALIVGCSTTRIPDGVKVIANSAFISCFGHSGSKIGPVSLVIPKSVEVIEPQAFTGFSSLTSVSFSEGLKRIENRAFAGTALTYLLIPASVEEICPEAFQGCDLLQTIKVKKGNKVYDSRKGCNAIIESRTGRLLLGCSATSIPNGVKMIGEHAFAKSRIEKLEIPSSLEEIEAHAFFNCKNLKEIVIPGTVKKIGHDAFRASALERVVVQEGVESIGSSAFGSCRELRSVSLPASVRTLGDEYSGIFTESRLLERVTMGKGNERYYCSAYVLIDKENGTIIDGWGTMGECYIGNSFARSIVKKIGRHAFYGHDLLASVVIPENVEEIEYKAFGGCKGLRVIECEAKVPPVLGTDVFKLNLGRTDRSLSLHERVVIVVPKGSLDAYRNAAGWKEFRNIVEE